MADPFDLLRLDDTAVHPSAQFAARLREQLAALEETLMTDARTGTPTLTSPTEHTVTPYLVVSDAAAAIDFYVAVLGAVEHHRLLDGERIGHAEILVGDTRLAIADEYPEYGIVGPAAVGGTSVGLTVLVRDADATYAAAVAAGATGVRPPSDQFHGHRSGQVLDPWGHRWTFSQPIHDRYREEATAEGFEYVPGAADAAGGFEHQVKHHERGDLYYFTLPTRDLARAKAFFGAVLGWQFDEEGSGHASNISAPPGGLHPGNTEAELWFTVPDIHAAVALVRELGGTATEPVLYDSGWAAECTDDQGTRFSLSVPAPKYTR